jgi:ubiquinone/menaquinone biosynthesis C-methylase UbiE
MSKEIIELGWQYHGCDASRQMIDEARIRVTGGSFSVGRAERIDSPDHAYDVVVAMGLVEYLDDERLALKEMRRVLRPDGRLLVSICNWWSPLRMWDRYLRAPLAKVLRPLLGRTTDGVFHRHYTTKEYSRLLEEQEFGDCSWVYYNFRLLPRPFDLWFPRVSVRIAKFLEPLRSTPLRFWGTGALVDARRTRDTR